MPVYGFMSGSAFSVAANAVSTNQLAGQLYEFLQVRSLVRYRASASAAGLNTTLLCVPRPGPVVNDQAISQANRWPILPDDLVTQFPASAGSRLVLTFRNTTVGVLTVNWIVETIG